MIRNVVSGLVVLVIAGLAMSHLQKQALQVGYSRGCKDTVMAAISSQGYDPSTIQNEIDNYCLELSQKNKVGE